MSFLLAPVGRANNGLTLVNAVNVFLLEQPACAAVELQCVNRVHRVGQTRPTTVYRYVVKDTIEDAIYEYHRTHTASVEEDVKEAEINAAKLASGARAGSVRKSRWIPPPAARTRPTTPLLLIDCV